MASLVNQAIGFYDQIPQKSIHGLSPDQIEEASHSKNTATNTF